MLLLSLTIVGILKEAESDRHSDRLLSPLMAYFSLPEVYVLPTLTKCLAGGTAYFGVMSELLRKGLVTPEQMNASAGFLIQTFDLPGIGIYLGIASRFVRLFRYVIPGVIVGIAVRSIITTCCISDKRPVYLQKKGLPAPYWPVNPFKVIANVFCLAVMLSGFN